MREVLFMSKTILIVYGQRKNKFEYLEFADPYNVSQYFKKRSKMFNYCIVD